MTWASPIETTDEERRRKGDVLQDGERIRFDVMVMDNGARSAAAYDSLPAEQREAAMAYDAMVLDLTQRGSSRPAMAVSQDASDAASAYDAMVADLHRNSR